MALPVFYRYKQQVPDVAQRRREAMKVKESVKLSSKIPVRMRERRRVVCHSAFGRLYIPGCVVGLDGTCTGLGQACSLRPQLVVGRASKSSLPDLANCKFLFPANAKGEPP